MRTHEIVLLLAVVMFRSAFAQSDSATGEIRGAVYDSVSHQPLSGAIVQLISTRAVAPFSMQVPSGVRGRFRFENVPPGSYVVGFEHAVLDTFALEPPARYVTVRDGQPVSVDLAVPSARTITRAICGDPIADSTGIIIGVLRDARTRMSADSGVVSASWDEYTIDASGFHRLRLSARGVVAPDGRYAVCGLPAGVELGVTAARGTESTGGTIVVVPRDGIIRRDLLIGGRATLRGSLVGDGGQPIVNGQVASSGSDRSATADSSGHFVLTDIVAGTQTVDARALGYAPAHVPIELRASADTTVAITMTSVRHVLATIRVSAQANYNRDLNGFERRRRQGGGYFMNGDDIQRKRASDMYAVLNSVPGLQLATGGRFGADRVPLMPDGGGGKCVPAVYIDGIDMPHDLASQMNFLANPREIAGMEVYRPGRAPQQFVSPQAPRCGAIVIWTQGVVNLPKTP